ncbi:hypothetical protein T265_11020 [Opisthorchis viverrini]|uniref:Uncharacterized protein n=1 Tax=Opisthorchis viverrini TaxID=6198 RepID=A0A074Z0H0_OPIVI|nr:hypothetical protein T265_11020 [Opisthorchis viverrini]KER20438.1 hypothetical protein T265_11020 [Opisthorchis viverrini]
MLTIVDSWKAAELNKVDFFSDVSRKWARRSPGWQMLCKAVRKKVLSRKPGIKNTQKLRRSEQVAGLNVGLRPVAVAKFFAPN